MLSSNVLKFKDSSRGETCKKLGIPVLSESYVYESTALGIKQVYFDAMFPDLFQIDWKNSIGEMWLAVYPYWMNIYT